jgi:excisionase family DNA binding protein
MDQLDIFPGLSRPGDDEARILNAESADAPLVLTIDEAAERLRIRRTLMYALVRSGEVESVLIGRRRRIPIDALGEFVRSLRGPSPSEVA